MISLPQESGFCTFFMPEGWGIRPFKKNSLESGLELIDTLVTRYWVIKIRIIDCSTTYQVNPRAVVT